MTGGGLTDTSLLLVLLAVVFAIALIAVVAAGLLTRQLFKRGPAVTRIKLLEGQLLENNRERNALRDENRNLGQQLAAAEQRVKGMEEQSEQAAEIAKARVKELTEEMLSKSREESGREYTRRSQALDAMLKPLGQSIGEFRKRMDEIHTNEASARTELRKEIELLHKNAAQYGQAADNLARTLKGDSKAQGDWGEVTLTTLLERSGLREGEEYESQKTLKGDDGDRLRPDVLINLPQNKHLILDSKVSLRAYHEFVDSDDKAQQKAALQRHVAAVRSHVNALAERHYAAARGPQTPDFVFMFMPIEPAFFAALKEAPGLFPDAYDKKVVLCAPTTVMAILSTVERIWRLERQSSNAEEIARLGSRLHDKFSGFAKNFIDVGRALNKASETYNLARNQMAKGPGNLMKTANDMRELGLSVKKQIPAAEDIPILEAVTEDNPGELPGGSIRQDEQGGAFGGQ